MSGQKGQCGPHYLKCSQCKKQRDHRGYARSGELVRTGRTKSSSIPARARRSDAPYLTAYELQCLRCGHIGWYTHSDAGRCALQQSTRLPALPRPSNYGRGRTRY